MKILFIKLKHIGDALLMTPLIRATRDKYPDATLWALVREGSQGILEGCPQLDKVLTTAAPEKKYRKWQSIFEDLRLIHSIRKVGFDYVIELGDSDRGRWLAFLSGAKYRVANAFSGKMSLFWRLLFNSKVISNPAGKHSVECDYFLASEVLQLSSIPPALVFENPRNVVDARFANLNNYVVVNPTTRWKRKRWATENWIEMCRRLLGVFEKVVLSVGPSQEEREIGQEILAKVGSAHLISTEGKLAFCELASIIKGAKLFVGADTVVMHLAAACQTPVFAIFGPSDESVWHPWKTHFHICSARKKLLKIEPNHAEIDINILNIEEVWSELFLFINKI